MPSSSAADLRGYQVAAVAAITAELSDEGSRTHAIMACGTGKSVVGLRAAEQLVPAGGSVAVFAPSLALVEQLHRTWTGAARRALTTMVVCSEGDVLSAGDLDGDDDRGSVPVTTDAAEIHDFVAGTSDRDLTVVFCTYHSAQRLGEATRAAGVTWSLLIDEAHRTAGKRGGAFSTVLSDRLVPGHRRLFLTATRRVHSDGNLLSMDDTTLYGPRSYTYPFGRAIADGWLSDYRVAVVVITDADVHRAMLSGASARIGGSEFNSEKAAAVLALQHASTAHNLRRVLTFHNTISASRQFSTNLKQLSASPAFNGPRPQVYHLDSLASPAARRSALEHLAYPEPDGWTVVNNVRVLAEGVDIPTLDAVMFAEPKRSQIDVVQAVGRAIRKNPDRLNPAIIMVPVYIAPGESPDAALQSSRYRHVWQVIRALRDHDDTLDDELTHIRRNDYDPDRSAYEPTALPEKIMVIGASLDATRFVGAVTTMLLNSTVSTWAEGLAEFRSYKEVHGDDAVIAARHVTATGFPLGQWQSAQRQAYRWNRLTDRQISDLESAGFTWGQRSVQWRKNIQKFATYSGLLGYTPPAVLLAYLDPPLMGWLMTVQDRRARGLLSPLELADLHAADIPSAGIGVADLDSTHRAEKLIRLLFERVRKTGLTRAGSGMITVPASRNKKRSGPSRANAVRYNASAVAEDVRALARQGMLDAKYIAAAHDVGFALPEPNPPIVDLESPGRQAAVLAAAAAFFTSRDSTSSSPIFSLLPSKVAAPAPPPRTTSSNPEGDDHPRGLKAFMTGPTVNRVGVTLTQLHRNATDFGRYDHYATELLDTELYADLGGHDPGDEFIVGLDHTVFKRSSAATQWTRVGPLKKVLDEVLIQVGNGGDEPVSTGPEPREPGARREGRTISVQTTKDVESLTSHQRCEFSRLVTEHVLRDQDEFYRRIMQRIFGIRVRLVKSGEEYDAAVRRARRNRSVVSTPPVAMAHAINSVFEEAYAIAASATVERTREAVYRAGLTLSDLLGHGTDPAGTSEAM